MTSSEEAGWIYLAVIAAGCLSWALALMVMSEIKARRFWLNFQDRYGPTKAPKENVRR